MSIEELFGARTATIVENVVDAIAAGRLRSELDGYTRYALVDRGSYEVADVDIGRDIVGVVARAASTATTRALVPLAARALRLRAGDYLLAHHDRVYEGHPVECMLDLSPRAFAAGVHYRRRGQVYFRVPCSPGSLSIVERGPTVTCNHTYISKREPDAEVVRLVVLLGEENAAR